MLQYKNYTIEMKYHIKERESMFYAIVIINCAGSARVVYFSSSEITCYLSG